MGPGCASSQRLAEELADEADRAKGNGEGAGQCPRSEDADEKQRPNERIYRPGRHQDQLGEQVDRRERDEVVRGEDADRECQDERQQSAQRCDVDRFQQRVVHAPLVVRPVDRPHAREEVRDLLRRIGQELRNDLDGLRRHDDRRHDNQVDDEARKALAAREAIPLQFRGWDQGCLCHQSSSKWRSRLAVPPRRKKSRSVALSMKIARTAWASSSPSMMSAMIEIRIAHT